MASSSGGFQGDHPGPLLPPYLDPRNEFGQLTILEMTRKDGKKLTDNPFLFGKFIESVAGGPIVSAKSEAKRTRYILHIRNPAQVEKLLALTNLDKNTEVSVTYHSKLNSCKCVIASDDLIDMSESEIQHNLADQGVSNVKRIKRKVNGSDTNTSVLVLTFAKTTYPKHVKVGVLRVVTRPFYPNPMQCYGCFVYGHVRSKCPGPRRCYNCSNEYHDETCETNPRCVNCNGEHRPTSRKCTVYQKECQIVKIKVDQNIPYPEARKRAGCSSYAQTVAQSRLDNVKLEALQEEIKQRDVRIAKLEASLESNKQKEEQIAQLIAGLKEKSEEVEKLTQMVSYLKAFVFKHIKKPQANEMNKHPKQHQPNSNADSNGRNTSRETGTKRKNKNRHEERHARHQNNPSDNKSPPPKKPTTEANPKGTDSAMDLDDTFLISDNDEADPCNVISTETYYELLANLQ